MPGEKVWVVSENYKGAADRAASGLLCKAHQLAETLGGGGVAAVLVGEDSMEAAQYLVERGADTVYMPETPLVPFQTDVCAAYVAGLAAEHRPEIVLWTSTSTCSEIASIAAARLDTGLTAHCIDLFIQQIDGSNQLVAAVAGYGGNVTMQIICPRRRPQMATAKAGIFGGSAPRTGKGEIIRVSAGKAASRLDIMEVVEEKGSED